MIKFTFVFPLKKHLMNFMYEKLFFFNALTFNVLNTQFLSS